MPVFSSLLKDKGVMTRLCLTAIIMSHLDPDKILFALSNVKGTEPQLCIVDNYSSLKEQIKMFLLLLHLFSILGVVVLASGQEKLLMVFGGLPNRPNSKNVTLLSVDGGPAVPECLRNLNPHPRNLWKSCPATLGDGKLVVNFFKTLNLLTF